jgi:hypothetical protein
MCVQTSADPSTCQLLCRGTPDEPQCPPGLACMQVDFVYDVYVCRPPN